MQLGVPDWMALACDSAQVLLRVPLCHRWSQALVQHMHALAEHNSATSNQCLLGTPSRRSQAGVADKRNIHGVDKFLVGSTPRTDHGIQKLDARLGSTTRRTAIRLGKALGWKREGTHECIPWNGAFSN